MTAIPNICWWFNHKNVGNSRRSLVKKKLKNKTAKFPQLVLHEVMFFLPLILYS